MPKPLSEIPVEKLIKIKWLLTDVDDTLTWKGELPAETISALTRLKDVGVNVVAVTGASAGWADQIARLWPVHGAIGENGAFWMRKTDDGFFSESMLPMDVMKLQQAKLIEKLHFMLNKYSDIDFANDLAFRFCDVAINLSQDREAVSPNISCDLLNKIRQLEIDGQRVKATASSIHINVWLGEHNKHLTSEKYLQTYSEQNTISFDQVAYIGDSLNDEAMFEWLPLTFGVKNIEPLLPMLNEKPDYITEGCGGYGFSELAESIVCAKQNQK